MNYKQFPQRELISEWDKLLKLSREDVLSLYEQWKVTEEQNKSLSKQMYEEKNAKIKEVAEYLKTQNIDVYKYKTKGLFHEKKGYQTWFKNNVVDVISKKYPYYSPCIPSAHTSEKIVDGIRLYNNQSPTNIVELYDKITNQYKQGKATVNKNNKLLIKSIEYANEHNIEIDDLPTDYIIKRVEEYAKEKWLNENVPNGTEIYLKHACSECSTYIMGERRCSCGNRRISIVVEGNILEGFYYYPEPY